MSKDYFVGTREFFPGIGKIAYEGPDSKNPLAYKFYDAGRLVAGKSMKDQLRFSMAYWHSLCASGGDPFGPGTMVRPWNSSADPLQAALDKADAAFEFMTKMGIGWYCFHDVDAAPDADDPGEAERNLVKVTAALKERQAATGVKLLWATANLFSHPRYMNGAATNPEFGVVARAAAQAKAAIDACITLGGQGYTFWGGREGYATLLNTDMGRERAHLGRFLALARDYGRSKGFTGSFYIEPKPMEPTKHQYDFDSATVIGFLREFGLERDFKLNIEANHATLAGHDFVHELRVAADAGLLGSIDANRGDPRNGWDTDQFPLDPIETAEVMRVVLGMGGFTTGGLNFDAKLRRSSTDLEDLFLAHIGGMDAFALGLLAAERIVKDGRLDAFVKARYASFDSGSGADFEKGRLDFGKLAASGKGGLPLLSGKQEYLENLFAQLVYGR
jgi:xylose isomerase